MTDQTEKALVPYERLKLLISGDEIQQRFKQVLGERAPGFLASVMNTVYTNKSLRDADPNTVIISALKAAVLDLPIDPNLGFAYIIPYNTKRGDTWVKEAQFQMGYKGYIQLALRTSQYSKLNAVVIYQGQRIIEDILTGDIKLNGQKISDEAIGYAAYFQLLNGFEKYLYMTKDEMTAHAKRYSKTWGKPESPWSTDFDKMGKKTVIKLLISKWGIMSIQMMQAFKDDRDDTSFSVSLSDARDDEDVFDTTATDVTDEPPTPPEPEQPPAVDIPAKLVADGKIDHANHAANIIKKRKSTCPLSEYDFVVAYTAWRTMGDEKQAAELANKGEMPK